MDSHLSRTPDETSLRRARTGTRAQFFALGLISGHWGAHIPSVMQAHQLSAGAFSAVLLAGAVGAVAALTVAGPVVHGLGPRLACPLAGLLLCASLAGFLFAPGLPALLLLALLFGVASAVFDVAINAEGTLLETLGGRKVLSGFHGMFSLGGMSGAALTAALLAAGMAPEWQIPLTCAATAALILAASRALLAQHPQPADESASYRRPTGVLLALGLLGGVAMLAEGAMYDWSVLYLKQELGSPQSLAALGYAAFSAAMAAARFGGDWLRNRMTPAQLLRRSAWAAAVAMAAVLWLQHPVATLLGFAVVGVGLANVVPVLFMAASRTPGVAPATAIATVSSLSYLGFLVGPPLVGGLAQLTSLSWGLSLVAVASLILASATGRLKVLH